MTDEQRQRISELQDGELDPAGTTRLVDLLAQDPELRASWERYHAIGLAMRGEPIMAVRRGIADSVRERVALEPTVLAPQRAKTVRRGSMKSVAGIALAAAAAFMAVFVAPGLFEGVGALQPDPPAAPTFAAGPSTVVLPAGLPVELQARRWDLDHPELVNKLDLFLLTHQETAPTTGAKGMLPYATFVGYEAGR